MSVSAIVVCVCVCVCAYNTDFDFFEVGKNVHFCECEKSKVVNHLAVV
jgi:hypothetical protein